MHVIIESGGSLYHMPEITFKISKEELGKLVTYGVFCQVDYAGTDEGYKLAQCFRIEVK